MIWFKMNDKVAWVRKKKNTETLGVIVKILEPGKRAEDELNEEERTRISTRAINSPMIPTTYRALVKVTDNRGYITYHMPNLMKLRKIEENKPIGHTATLKTLKR